jgi:diphthine synthase
MVLYIVGLGLGDERDVTVRGLEAIQRSDKVFLEAYTSILSISHERLQIFYKKSIIVADRNFVECQAEQIYEPAKDGNVSFLVVGDPVCATTHTDIILRAREFGVSVEMIHNASVMGAVGSCGLQLYNFGATISIPFFETTWRPTSFYNKILYNRKGGMHTLCLLDIKVKEPDFEGMIRNRGKVNFLPPRYMSVNVALEQLMEVEEIEKSNAYDSDLTLCVGMARLGQIDQCIKAGTMQELLREDFGEPLHCLVICGETHELEREYLKQFIVQDSKAT